jgi:hypothetical protein
MRIVAGAGAFVLCFLVVCTVARSQAPTPTRQVSGSGVQASFHVDDGEDPVTDVLIAFNDNARMTGAAPALLVQVIETTGEKTVFQSGPSPSFSYSETSGILNVYGKVTVTQQPNNGSPETRVVTFNVSWGTGGNVQGVTAQATYHQPNFHYDQNLQGSLQQTTVSTTSFVLVDEPWGQLEIPLDPSSTPASWSTDNSRNDHFDKSMSPSGSALATAATCAGHWTGYWTWNATAFWYWTWIWVPCSGGWVAS